MCRCVIVWYCLIVQYREWETLIFSCFLTDNRIYGTGGLDPSLVGDVRLDVDPQPYEALGQSTTSNDLMSSNPYEVPYTMERNGAVSPYQVMSSSRAGSLSTSVTQGVGPNGYPIPAPYEGMVWWCRWVLYVIPPLCLSLYKSLIHPPNTCISTFQVCKRCAINITCNHHQLNMVMSVARILWGGLNLNQLSIDQSALRRREYHVRVWYVICTKIGWYKNPLRLIWKCVIKFVYVFGIVFSW